MGQSLANAMRLSVLQQALGYGANGAVDAMTFAARLSNTEARAKVDAAIAYQKEHFDSLRLQLGFAYGDGLKADDVLPISEFTPKAVVGARLPHVPLADGRSTLDLVDVQGFTLICAPSNEAWHRLLDGCSVPLTIAAEGRDFEASSGSWSVRMGLAADGALLVRPDGHILCRANSASTTDSRQLAEAIDSYVGRAARPAAARTA
jgi:hypothetical protein